MVPKSPAKSSSRASANSLGAPGRGNEVLRIQRDRTARAQRNKCLLYEAISEVSGRTDVFNHISACDPPFA